MNSITNDGMTIRACPREQSRVGDGKLHIIPKTSSGSLTSFNLSSLPGSRVRWKRVLRRFDGEYRWFLIRAAPLRDEKGKIVYWYGSSTDIEDRKRAEEKLRQDERELRRIIPMPYRRPLLSRVRTVFRSMRTKPCSTTHRPNHRRCDRLGFPCPNLLYPEDIERLREERQAGPFARRSVRD